MTSRDPRKAAGEMCFAGDCTQTEGLHGITRKCGYGHRETLRYCGDHIDSMMELAFLPPGSTIDGTVIGKSLCRECGLYLELVLEGVS